MVDDNTVHHADIFDLCAALEPASVDMILCDLPYGTTACAWDTVIPFEPMWAAFRRIVKPRAAIVLTASQPFTSALIASNYALFRYCWYWNKGVGANFSSTAFQPLRTVEEVVVFSEGAITFNIRGTYMPYYQQKQKRDKAYTRDFGKGIERQSITAPLRNHKRDQIEYTHTTPKSLLYFSPRSETERLHPTQKPVALFEYLIRTYTQPGALVFDPCCGSGTTAIAARREGRRYIVGDSSAEYVELTQKRLDVPYTIPMTFESEAVS